MKAQLKIDPVCGMNIEPSHAVDETQFGGQTFYFCSPSCRLDFDQDPPRYLSVHPDAARSRSSNPTTPQAFQHHTHHTRQRGLSHQRAGAPGSRPTRSR